MPDNIKLFRLFQFSRSLLFWQAIWFLYFQDILSARDAILLIAISDLGAILLEVPSGYLSDLAGRRVTLVFAAVVSAPRVLHHLRRRHLLDVGMRTIPSGNRDGLCLRL